MAQRRHTVVAQVKDPPMGGESMEVEESPMGDMPAPLDATAAPMELSQSAVVGERAIINGTAFDMGDTSSPLYVWTIFGPPGVEVALTNPDKVSPSFVPDAPGEYTVLLATPSGDG